MEHALPFLLLMAIAVAIIWMIPGIVTDLPQRMLGKR